jgi:transcription antitermination factor NusG
MSPIVPKMARRTVERGRVVERQTPMLAGYVLAAGAMTAERWHHCIDGNSYIGGDASPVTGFLGDTGPEQPWAPVSQTEVDKLLEQCDRDAVLHVNGPQRRRFRHGRRVRLVSGAFAGYSATVRRDDGRAVVLRLDSGWPAHVAPEACVGV